MITGSGYISKSVQSLYNYLSTTTYVKSNTNVTLLSAFENLKIVPGFPDTLEKLTLPTLSILTTAIGNQDNTYTNGVRTIIITFSIYGFCGGRTTDNENLALRDDLCSDVRELLEDTDYITLYDYPDFSTSQGDMSIENVESRFIEPTGPLNAEKFRFVIDLECEYAKSIEA